MRNTQSHLALPDWLGAAIRLAMIDACFEAAPEHSKKDENGTLRAIDTTLGPVGPWRGSGACVQPPPKRLLSNGEDAIDLGTTILFPSTGSENNLATYWDGTWSPCS